MFLSSFFFYRYGFFYSWPILKFIVTLRRRVRKQVVDARSKAASYWPASSSLRNTAASYRPTVSALREAAASYWPDSFSLKKAAGSVEGSDSTSTPVTRPAGEKLKGLQAGHSTKTTPCIVLLFFYETKRTPCIVLFFTKQGRPYLLLSFLQNTDAPMYCSLFLRNKDDPMYCSLFLRNKDNPIYCSLFLRNTDDPMYCSLFLRNKDDPIYCSLFLRNKDDPMYCSLFFTTAEIFQLYFSHFQKCQQKRPKVREGKNYIICRVFDLFFSFSCDLLAKLAGCLWYL